MTTIDLHAATVIALADTACGYGTFTDLPSGAKNFTTRVLKTNFSLLSRTTREGSIACITTRLHNGWTTKVWDVQVAIAWILSKPVVTSPIIGGTKPHHLEDAVAALSIQLTPEEIKQMEEGYVMHTVLGYV